jgi:hypothetical protein
MDVTDEVVWYSSDELPLLSTWAQKTQSVLVPTLFPEGRKPSFCPLSHESDLVRTHNYILELKH